jgi:hypothetical protein
MDMRIADPQGLRQAGRKQKHITTVPGNFAQAPEALFHALTQPPLRRARLLALRLFHFWSVRVSVRKNLEEPQLLRSERCATPSYLSSPKVTVRWRQSAPNRS